MTRNISNVTENPSEPWTPFTLWQPPSRGQHKSPQATAVLHKLDLDGLPAQHEPSQPKRALHFGLGYSHAELQTTKLALKQLNCSSIGWSRWDGTSFSVI